MPTKHQQFPRWRWLAAVLGLAVSAVVGVVASSAELEVGGDGATLVANTESSPDVNAPTSPVLMTATLT
jgi:hypothetical protein